MQDYFSLFKLPERFALDTLELEASYRQVQAQVHPDKFADRPEAERRVAMQWATLVNEAYRTLRSPLTRARYLLERRDVHIDADRNTSMSKAFLMQQMQWREAVEEAALDLQELTKLQHNLDTDERLMVDDLRSALDEEVDHALASELVRRLMFLEKLRQEIDDAIAMLEE